MLKWIFMLSFINCLKHFYCVPQYVRVGWGPSSCFLLNPPRASIVDHGNWGFQKPNIVPSIPLLVTKSTPSHWCGHRPQSRPGHSHLITSRGGHWAKPIRSLLEAVLLPSRLLRISGRIWSQNLWPPCCSLCGPNCGRKWSQTERNWSSGQFQDTMVSAAPPSRPWTIWEFFLTPWINIFPPLSVSMGFMSLPMFWHDSPSLNHPWISLSFSWSPLVMGASQSWHSPSSLKVQKALSWKQAKFASQGTYIYT